MGLKSFFNLGAAKSAVFIQLIFSLLVNYVVLRKGALDVYILKSNLCSVLKIFKLGGLFSCKLLSDIVAADFVGSGAWRFKLSYNLLSKFGMRFFVHTFVKEAEFCSSVLTLFKSAGWVEREIWDLYGIYFINHTDLRRILTDYGFRGFPFRKDFPLTGYIELRFDDQRGDVVYEPVELTQEMRFFNFATGWETD